MTAAAWVCLLSPLAGALLITLLGTRISRSAAAVLSTLSVGVAAVAAARHCRACVPTQELPRPRNSQNSVLGFPTVLHAVPRGWC